MLFLITFQAFLSILYFVTSPFDMNWGLWVTLVVNLLALTYLWKHYRFSSVLNNKNARLARLIFTATLFLLEFLILFTSTPVSSTGILGLINDSEVFITGILVGALWRNEILGKSTYSQKLSSVSKENAPIKGQNIA